MTFKQCSRNLNKKKLPCLKLPVLKPNTNNLMQGLRNGILNNVIKINCISQEGNIKRQGIKKQEKEKKPISAGRGGKYYSTGSHYSRF